MLAAARLLALITMATPAWAQSPDSRVEATRIDAQGIEWVYTEDVDALDDRRQVVAFATLPSRGPSPDAAIGMHCVEGWGASVRFDVPTWNVAANESRTLQARIDRGDAFTIEAVGMEMARTMVGIVYARGGRELLEGLRTARERIVIRGPDNAVIVFPMTGERPEIIRATDRCTELNPPR